jgi:hypothetical protein
LKENRASQEEIDGLIKFMRELESKVEQGDAWELMDFLHESNGVPSWERVVFGYQVMLDNVCDPDVDYLALKSAE